ncbi:sulfur carrier protein ThiS [Labrys sp. LIt4]|uniref:sulfur carrier protein ThiS n=1 Tax=Labrys sp. LIt4 TaxID=2821355 RepID=UPI001AE0E3E5|nr:sulfur carrier protein ThiS [Labrys sp. LIt4]MBP0582342.1 sulfur carrier protein ThiS [Labrys sp. LIt4]
MTLIINGERQQTEAATLARLLETLELGDSVVATALNGRFVRAVDRERTALKDGDAVEILAPRQGG